jgi:hypothetical protein
MASIITATVASGLTQSADNSGVLQLASGSGNLVTVPSVTGTAMVSGNMPAFSAWLSSNQTVSNSTFTKLQANTEEFDTASCYDNSTNYRFTPNVAGYYQVNGNINITSTNNTDVLCVIYKNGSSLKWGNYATRTSVNFDQSSVASALIYCNGTTDYLELFGYVSGTGTLQFIGSQQRTFFQAVMVRAA